MTPAGHTPISFGSSYIEVVTFDRHGPIADAILTCGQSSNPDSPHFRDQTEQLFSAKHWLRLPFSERRIESDAALTRLRLRERCEDCRGRSLSGTCRARPAETPVDSRRPRESIGV